MRTDGAKATANMKTPEKTYAILELWTDSLENRRTAAIGYEIIGFTPDKAEAEAMVASAGSVEGSGWPIAKGENMPRLAMREITRLTPSCETAKQEFN